MRVFIIEPDHILGKEYRRVFKDFDIEASVFSDAQSAVHAIDKKPPDAVIIELQLAGHSGIEFIHEFRTYEDWASIPLFINSNVPERAIGADEKTWSKFGVVRYFYKPKTSLKQMAGIVKGAIDSDK
jgi:DNA-binding response OmpR family regulator